MAAEVITGSGPLPSPEELSDEELAAVHKLHDITHPSRPGGVYDAKRNPSGCDKVFCCFILPKMTPTVEPAIRADEQKNAGVVTMSMAHYLADLVQAVEYSKKMEWYPHGASLSPADTFTLRAFVRNEQNFFYPAAASVLDALVWCSGITEHWLPVRDILAALENGINGTDETQPMAVIRAM
jgi:hypothetical protein